MDMGAVLFAFEDVIQLENLNLNSFYNKWIVTNNEIPPWIYLMPFMGYFLIYNFLSINRKFPVTLNLFIQLLQSWGFLLLLVFLFFMPLAEIINKQGIYYSLLWLHTNYTKQLIFGVVLVIFGLYRSVNISQLFSTTLIVKPNKKLSVSYIIKQLIFIWYIPFIILAFIVMTLCNFNPGTEIVFLFSEVLMMLLINTVITLRYRIITLG